MTIIDPHFHTPGCYEISIRLIGDESIAGRVGAILHNQGEDRAMLRQLNRKVEKLMRTAADIKAAELDFGVEFDKLVALTNSIADKLSGSPVSEDPAVQEVLDMIAAHKTAAGDTITRDTPPETPTPAA